MLVVSDFSKFDCRVLFGAVSFSRGTEVPEMDWRFRILMVRTVVRSRLSVCSIPVKAL